MNLPRDLAGLSPLAAAVRDLLPQQRWFVGHERPLRVEAVACCWVREQVPALALTVWAVADGSGSLQHYHLPLGFRPASEPLPPGLEPLARDAAGAAPDGDWLAYDGLADLEAASHLLAWLDRTGGEPCLGGRVSRRRTAGAERLDRPLSASPLGGDHSNSGVVFEDRILLKVFRRLWPGVNPEVELAETLLQVGFDRLPRPLLSVELEAPDGPWSLAAAQAYVRHGTDGFSLALTSLRDLFGDLHFEADGAVPMPEACEEAVAAQGGSFEIDAERIGNLTGRMHRALAMAPGGGTAAEPVREEDLIGWADEMEEVLERLLAGRDDRLEALRPQAQGVRRAFARLRALSPEGQRVRLHGDYHLGQLLRVDDGWLVLDFEGEPARPIVERRQRRSPLQDVAGMLRSFDYASAVALRQQASPEEPRWASLAPYGRTWAGRNRDRFLGGYLAEVNGSELLPRTPGAVDVELRAFQLGKALYEVGYELAHRPDWISIPLADIVSLRTWSES